MTNLEKLKQLYEDKAKAGLVHVSFFFTDAASKATAEQLASEVLAMENAIQSGNFKDADFGDSNWLGTQSKTMVTPSGSDAGLISL